VASLQGPAGDAALADARQVLREALRHSTLRHGTRRTLGALLHGRGVLLLLGDGTDVDDVAHRLHDHVSGRLGLLPGDIATAVAVSDPQPSLDRAHLAYDQALRVCRVATAVGGFDAVVTSTVLGVYDVLGRLPESALSREVLPPGLLRLVDRQGDSETLVSTLECYLDHAGNAVAAAQQLLVHRGTLYYRLDRIEEITGVELRDGMQRLSLHVGIKLARLAGIIG
jgi:DNA-binding PucR family transcriptional regulator